MSDVAALTLNLNKTEFLQQDWQQRPRLFRAAFADFEDLVEAEILAGLACEEAVDSRIIENHQGNWNVVHGPFEAYDAFGESGWTLLVQSVNEWIPEVQQLIAPFRFLPDWRIDDVMISFATEGGGVGPHLDQYDVFIIQGQGRRHWRVGERVVGAEEHCPHPDLKQLAQPFTALIDAVLEPGDMLYIPAGCPHEGIALEPSLNYSVGFRAQNSAELTTAVCDHLLSSSAKLVRYRDPHSDDYGAPYQVSQSRLDHLREFALSQLTQLDWDSALMAVLSTSKRPLPQPEAAPSEEELQFCLANQEPLLLCRTPGARILLGPDGHCYSNGEQLALTDANRPFAEYLAGQWQDLELTELTTTSDLDWQHPAALQLLSELVQMGVFYLVDASDEDTDEQHA